MISWVIERVQTENSKHFLTLLIIPKKKFFKDIVENSQSILLDLTISEIKNKHEFSPLQTLLNKHY